jgi:hypothetical protein
MVLAKDQAASGSAAKDLTRRTGATGLVVRNVHRGLVSEGQERDLRRFVLNFSRGVSFIETSFQTIREKLRWPVKQLAMRDNGASNAHIVVTMGHCTTSGDASARAAATCGDVDSMGAGRVPLNKGERCSFYRNVSYGR